MQRAALVCATVLLTQTACRGCESPPTSPVPPKVTDSADGTELPSAPTPVAASPLPALLPVATTPVAPETGPAAVDAGGFRISTGFLDRRLQPLPQPQAGALTQVLVTALDPQGHTLGQLAPVAEQQMHGFLLAKDLRHVRYAATDRPVRENADARALPFAPPGGGDHVLVTIFQPVGGVLHAVTAPVTVAGHLPTIAGPGLAGLPVGTTQPPQPRTGEPLTWVFGKSSPRLVVLLDAAMAHATVLLPDAAGVVRWSTPEAGRWLVLVPPDTQAHQGHAHTEDAPADAYALHVAPAGP